MLSPPRHEDRMSTWNLPHRKATTTTHPSSPPTPPPTSSLSDSDTKTLVFVWLRRGCDPLVISRGIEPPSFRPSPHRRVDIRPPIHFSNVSPSILCRSSADQLEGLARESLLRLPYQIMQREGTAFFPTRRKRSDIPPILTQYLRLGSFEVILPVTR